nr:hypothetical protein [Actinomadura sp. CNU-125]
MRGVLLVGAPGVGVREVEDGGEVVRAAGESEIAAAGERADLLDGARQGLESRLRGPLLCRGGLGRQRSRTICRSMVMFLRAESWDTVAPGYYIVRD